MLGYSMQLARHGLTVAIDIASYFVCGFELETIAFRETRPATVRKGRTVGMARCVLTVDPLSLPRFIFDLAEIRCNRDAVLLLRDCMISRVDMNVYLCKASRKLRIHSIIIDAYRKSKYPSPASPLSVE